jgi:hypothetical protein
MERQQKSRQLIPIRIIIDEVWAYQRVSPDALLWLEKLMVDGLRWNIQTVITAHTPTMVESTIYKNVHVWYFFKLNNAIYKYFKRDWQIDLFQYKDYLNTPYNYLIYDGNEFIMPNKNKQKEDAELERPTEKENPQ